MTNALRPKARLQELDALRGLGALAVVIFHYSVRFHELFPTARHVPFAFAGGNYRVYLFFAISGFAIFFTLEKIRTAADFVVGRIARLYPAYWTAILLTLGFEYLGHVKVLEIPYSAVAANFTMFQGFALLPAVDGAYWTLTVELAFYMCMVGLWFVFGLRHVERLLLAWLAIKWLWWVIPDMPERIVMVLLLRYVCFFAVGIIAYRVWSGQRTWRQQGPVLACLFLTAYLLDGRTLFLIASALAALFYALLAGWMRFLCVRPLLWLGTISYPLYLVHQHIGFVIMLKADATGIAPGYGFVVALASALLLAVLINHYIEEPANRAIRSWWKHRSRIPGDPAPAA
ncbi:MAG: acyltransferase [Alphaproteobacteria bacterium]|nr:acyltransferase [Alphaproteobacteria bacterium]